MASPETVIVQKRLTHGLRSARMTRGERPPLKPGQVYGEFVSATGTAFVLQASTGGHRMAVRLHHDQGPEIAVVCWPLEPSRRLLRWQGRLWSSNPTEWKQDLKARVFVALDGVHDILDGPAEGPVRP